MKLCIYEYLNISCPRFAQPLTSLPFPLSSSLCIKFPLFSWYFTLNVLSVHLSLYLSSIDPLRKELVCLPAAEAECVCEAFSFIWIQRLCVCVGREGREVGCIWTWWLVHKKGTGEACCTLTCACTVHTCKCPYLHVCSVFTWVSLCTLC